MSRRGSHSHRKHGQFLTINTGICCSKRRFRSLCASGRQLAGESPSRGLIHGGKRRRLIASSTRRLSLGFKQSDHAWRPFFICLFAPMTRACARRPTPPARRSERPITSMNRRAEYIQFPSTVPRPMSSPARMTITPAEVRPIARRSLLRVIFPLLPS